MVPTKITFDQLQRNYTFRLFCLSDIHLAKDIISLSHRDKNEQDRLYNNFEDKIWAANKKTKTFGQLLGRQVFVKCSIDQCNRVEPVVLILVTDLDEKFLIKNVELAFQFARDEIQELILCCDRFKHNQGWTKAAVA